MKKSLLLIVLVIPIVIFAQNEDDPCASIQGMYDKKVEENYVLRSDVKRLHNDSIRQEETIANLLQDTAQLGQSLLKTEQMLTNARKELSHINSLLTQCRKDSVQMQKQLKKCSIEDIRRNEDSIQSLNHKIAVLNDSIAHLNIRIIHDSKISQKQRQDIDKLNVVVAYLDKQFANKSVDDLYKMTDKKELMMIAEIYGKLGKELPMNIKLTLTCFAAEELATKKYDKIHIDKAIATLPQSTKTGKAIAKRLQDYGVVNADALKLWNNIRTEVCSEEIPNDDFTQIQKKRQIWQRTQKFLNQHPTLSTDYPYIADQLQSMLRQIWLNANNFNTIPNPFE